MFIDKQELNNQLKRAIQSKKGFAFGKIGFSEQFILGYLPFLESSSNILHTKAYETVLRFHCEKQTGVFPTTPDFLAEFADFYTKTVRNLDVLGSFGADQEKELIIKNKLNVQLVPYKDMEPDRSVPEQVENCYLPLFENKKILYISPFAELLKERSSKEIYEKVWDKINKKWFYPKEVCAVEIPYSYITECSTHKKYTTSLNLFKSICEEIDKQDYDVALIGAGALGIPLASYIKEQNKIGLSLGGHLQVMLGINGSRWRNDDYWKKNYINNAWIDMPSKYHPNQKNTLTDSGAYW
jgi:hypothetical protein